jgi:hypothetical protein
MWAMSDNYDLMLQIPFFPLKVPSAREQRRSVDLL